MIRIARYTAALLLAAPFMALAGLLVAPAVALAVALGVLVLLLCGIGALLGRRGRPLPPSSDPAEVRGARDGGA